MRVSMETRAAVCAAIIKQQADWGGEVTNYSLAKELHCTPSTIANCIMRHGSKFGVTYRKVKHRPNVFKKIYTIFPTDYYYRHQNYIHLAYMRYFQMQLPFSEDELS